MGCAASIRNPQCAIRNRETRCLPSIVRAGVRRQESPNLFRHSAASIVHAQTRDVSLAQELLGHSRLSTTADIYTHTRTEAEEATETLAREIWGNRGLTVAEGSMQVN